ncbi:MAG: (R)-hydratase [Rhodobacterales bacterium CG15_BIG_FIL_POST_REV_8_21_14_020_59_13]|nr:MAG: (R)-hydratase [Rhodobacterales bacterium CG15_BIG_FIL_POST_REV_8_21_14_020_59_13]
MMQKAPIPLEDFCVGQSAEITRLVDDETVRAFADVSGDHNPLHLDEEFARRTPYRGRIAHGALIASYLSALLGNVLPGPGSIFVSMDIGFRSPVRIGDTVRSRGEITSINLNTRMLELACSCMVGETVVMTARASVMVRTRKRKSAE